MKETPEEKWPRMRLATVDGIPVPLTPEQQSVIDLASSIIAKFPDIASIDAFNHDSNTRYHIKTRDGFPNPDNTATTLESQRRFAKLMGWVDVKRWSVMYADNPDNFEGAYALAMAERIIELSRGFDQPAPKDHKVDDGSDKA